MNKFKPGDYVVPIRVNRREYTQKMKLLFGVLLTVAQVSEDEDCSTVFAGSAGSVDPWRAEDLYLADTDEKIAAAIKLLPPLKRGELVEYQGDIWVVTNGTLPTDLFAKISSVTGKERARWVAPDAVVLVGNIRKKVKRIKKEMECEK